MTLKSDSETSRTLFFTYLKLLLTAIFWGGTFIAGRVIAQSVDPYSAAFIRFFIAATILLLMVYKIEKGFPRLDLNQTVQVILLGLTGVLGYNIFFFKGLKLIPASRAALIIATNPIVISLLSALLFKEKLRRIQIIGIIISVVGAIIAITHGNLLQFLREKLSWGDAFIFVCVLCWVAYSIIGKTVLNKLSPLTSVAYSAAVGAIGLFIPALNHQLIEKSGSFPGLAWIGLFYLALFGTVLGFKWYYEGIKAIGPTRAGLFINFVPISAIFLAFFILNEPITFSLVLGTVMVSSGVYFTNKKFLVSRD